MNNEAIRAIEWWVNSGRGFTPQEADHLCRLIRRNQTTYVSFDPSNGSGTFTHNVARQGGKSSISAGIGEAIRAILATGRA